MRRLSLSVETIVAPRCCCAPSTAALATSPVVTSVRTLRNLHHYRHARHKSLVKERLKYSRNWYLVGGNNYELSETTAHEREAFENFGEYRFDSTHDKYVVSTSNPNDLPPHERLSALINGLMRDRWKVKDHERGFDKTKLLLQVLECFSEMKQLGQFSCFDEMPEADQDTFLQHVTSCSAYAMRCSHSHPDAVAVLIRAAEICDELGCGEKRDETLNFAERCARTMGRALAHERLDEPLKLSPIRALDENCIKLQEKKKQVLERLYPELVDEEDKPEFFPSFRKQRRPTKFRDIHEGYLLREIDTGKTQME